MCGLLTNYYKYIIGKTRAVANKFSIFNFNKLKKAVNLLYIVAAKDVKYIAIFLKKYIKYLNYIKIIIVKR